MGGTGTLVVAIAGGPVLLASLYLVVLVIAALRRPPAARLGRGDSRLAVLVPAHDEEDLLPRCIAALRAQDYPEERCRIVVIADNCTDATARVGADAGAEVMVRTDAESRGKGRALRWAMDRLLAEPDPVDAIAVVDADSVPEPGLLRHLEGALIAGAEAAQADYVVLGGTGHGAALREAAFLLFHRARFSGRAVLGLPCSLVGNGMLFQRRLLERLPWNAFTGAEDLEYSTDLRLAGVRPCFVGTAAVAGPAPGFGRAAATQRMRWEGGRFHVVCTRLPKLLAGALRRRDPGLLDAAIDLSVPPLGLLTILCVLGSSAGIAAAMTGAVRPWAGVSWWAASLLLTAYVLIGLRAAGAPASAYRALLLAPRFLVAKLGTYARLSRGLRADRWERTEREGQQPVEPVQGATPAVPAPPRQRVNVCGIPIDMVDETQAAERIMAAVGTPTLLQVSTVNLQFLVTARRRPEVRRALQGCGLNVADGAPVIWLARLLGRRLPSRVAGVDLVPIVMRLAAERRRRVFLLGGTGGVAAEAARVLRRQNPDLVISGIFEPALMPLEAISDEEILGRIGSAGADILLVAFGHPKQDLWIARNRDRLPVSVALGVGGTLDLIAGRFRRAPGWARRSGLEWLFRLLQEPRRLALRYAACAAWLLGVLVPVAAWQRLAGVPVMMDGEPPEPLAAEAAAAGPSR